ncbi:MAG: Gfo/Idh/MocA family oxidoreductase [Lentisphaeria bacterium]|nr:Gfo/Idh/MocA family oxidoreductase [Lentisphaeria bacterium]
MKKIALVGCAHIHTPNFVKKLAARPDVQVVSVWDHDAARAQKNATELKSSCVATPDAIWQDKSIDAVVICSETNRHGDLVIQAAQAGKHLFVEKPLGFSAADGWAMAAAIKKAGVLFQTGYFMRGLPIHLFIKQQLQAGAFGKVTRIRHSNCHSGSLGGWFDKDWRWMADPAIAGCGAFGDLGTHSLDIILWWLGVAPDRVTANIEVVTKRYGDCDESGEGLLRFPDGCTATLAAGWVDVANPVTFLVSGTEGHAHISNGQLFFTSKHVAGADGKSPWTALPEAQPHAFDLFLDAVNGKKTTLVSADEAALRSAVMEAMYASTKDQKWHKPVMA